MRLRFSAGFLLLLSWGGAVSHAVAMEGEQPAILWKREVWSPRPQEDDLVLPMPCGGAMVFRPVDVLQDGLLDDHRLTMGGSGHLPAGGSYTGFVGGGFTVRDNPGVRRYFLAKYETSRIQWASMEKPCPVPDLPGGRFPVTGKDLVDVRKFARDYGLWLHRFHPGLLPSEEGVPGFPRLPSEAEWEYAARGGAAVSAAIFSERLFPMPDGMERYVWFQGTVSSGNELQPTGLLKPNPLGLHDMIGNAWEYVADLFHLVRERRLHGQAGGGMVKGGDYLSPPGDLSSGFRAEVLPFGDSGLRYLPSTGFRLALVAPVLPGPVRFRALEAARGGLARNAPEGDARTPGDLDGLIRKLMEQVVEAGAGDMEEDLRMLQGLIVASIQERDFERARAVRETLRVGAILAQKLGQDEVFLRSRERQLEAYEREGEAFHGLLARLRRVVMDSARAQRDNAEFYMARAIRLGEAWSGSLTEEQGRLLAEEFRLGKVPHLERFMKAFVGDADRFRQTGALDQTAIRRRLAALFSPGQPPQQPQ